MKTNLLKFCLLLFLPFGLNAQNIYFDPVTTIALKTYSDNLKKKQNQTIEQQTKLQQAQAWVASQMAWANTIQDKVHKGLREVSGTVQNGVQVMNIYNSIDRCVTYSTQLSNIVSQYPEYAVFGVAATQKTYQEVLNLTTEISDILASGDLNLATAGDRKKVLSQLDHRIKMLRIYILGIKMKIEHAIYIGFWKSINPFQQYINTDKDIVQNIMYTYKHRF